MTILGETNLEFLYNRLFTNAVNIPTYGYQILC